MATSLRKKSGITFGVIGLGSLLASMLLMGACALKESTSGDEEGGFVIAVKDSSRILLNFDSDTATIFTDSGTFNLVELRNKMNDKGINSDSIRITGIEVAYDDSTKAFIAANEGVHFYLRIYTRDDAASAKKLALETLVNDDVKSGLKALAFDPDMTMLLLNKHIFGAAEGFPGVLSAIKDKTKTSIQVIAELTLKERLKKPGTLKLNMVVTVAGKV